eukprot:6336783-Karenia_brevis.AAC.1
MESWQRQRCSTVKWGTSKWGRQGWMPGNGSSKGCDFSCLPCSYRGRPSIRIFGGAQTTTGVGQQADFCTQRLWGQSINWAEEGACCRTHCYQTCHHTKEAAQGADINSDR